MEKQIKAQLEDSNSGMFGARKTNQEEIIKQLESTNAGMFGAR